MLALHIKLEQVLRPIGPLNRSRQLRNSKIKHRFSFFFPRRCPRRHRRHFSRSLFSPVDSAWRINGLDMFFKLYSISSRKELIGSDQ